MFAAISADISAGIICRYVVRYICNISADASPYIYADTSTNTSADIAAKVSAYIMLANEKTDLPYRWSPRFIEGILVWGVIEKGTAETSQQAFLDHLYGLSKPMTSGTGDTKEAVVEKCEPIDMHMYCQMNMYFPIMLAFGDT